MCWVRPRLARVAAGWLVFQLALLISVPTTLCSMNAGHVLGAQCTCDHADRQMCPMHHTRTQSRGASGSQSCSCRSTSDPTGAVAAALSGPPAVLAGDTHPIASLDIAVCAAVIFADPADW